MPLVRRDVDPPLGVGYDPQPGEINCRARGDTYEDVNYYTCTDLADTFGIHLEFFFFLNPTLLPDCSNIQPNSKYCVAGFIEPVRARDGLCGPPNNNATCQGLPTPCCNSETWRCGNSTADCAPGICYEGSCAGHNVFTTDGTCGHQNKYRQCAGKWADCCALNGICGSGEDACGSRKCQLGKCVDFGFNLTTTTSATAVPTTATTTTAATAVTSTSATSTPTGTAFVPGGSGFGLGCYTDSAPGQRALPNLHSDDEMTVEMCLGLAAGYKYVGIEYGRECWWGDVLDPSSAHIGSENCMFICPGNQFEYCGAGYHLILYSPDAPLPTTTGTSTSVAASTTSTSTPTFTSSSATSTPTGPAFVPGGGGFELLGCYTEPASGGRALANLYADDNMTIETCLLVASGYAYAGVEYGRECWYGNTLSPASAHVGAGDCQMLCPGNAFEYRGNGNRLILYSTAASSSTSASSAASTSSTTASATSTPVFAPGGGGFALLGCYTELTSGARALANVYADDAMTIELCLATAAGHHFAGVEYGRECWYGDTLSAASAHVAAAECQMLCPGNALEYCGNGNRLVLYSDSTPTPLAPPAHPATVAGAFFTDGAMTLDICASLCSGYEYFGPEYTIEYETQPSRYPTTMRATVPLRRTPSLIKLHLSYRLLRKFACRGLLHRSRERV